MTETSPKALITGASSGLGQAMTGLLEERGWAVVTLDREPEAQTTGYNNLHIQCDLSDRDMLDRNLPAIIAAGPYDLVFLNAGINATGKFSSMPVDVLVNLVRVNAEAPMIIASALLRENALRPDARLSFVSSLSHFTGYPGAAAYAASKDTLAVFARSIRKPASARQVTVSSVFPGPLRTGHAQRHAPQGADAEKRMPPDKAAVLILEALEKGATTIIPGGVPKVYAGLGRAFPGSVTGIMRKLIFEKLDGEKW